MRDAPILVLDEATSAVDPETEIAVHEVMCHLMSNKTTVVIAHHSTAFIEYVNRAFALEGGRLRPVPVSDFIPANNHAREAALPAP